MVNVTCSRPQRNVHRPGFEPGTPWSEIRRPYHWATPPPSRLPLLGIKKIKTSLNRITNRNNAHFSSKQYEIFNICKISFNKRYLLHTYILLCTIATFQKAGTCLEAQQSMAKQPIKGCVSNHSRTCGKSVSEKSE